MTDIAIDITNVQKSIENTIHDYRTLAGKATRNDSSHTGVVAALERFFHKLEFLLKYGYLPVEQDANQDGSLPYALQELRAFLENTSPKPDDSYVLQRNETERYSFSWQKDGKLTVTVEVFNTSPTGGWSTQSTTQNVEPSLMRRVFNENLTKMMDAKLDAFLQKITNGLWPASEKEVLIHNMGGLRTQLAQQIRDLTDEQLSDVALYLDRIIFLFTIECLSTIDDAAQNYSLQLGADSGIIYDNYDVFTVQLCRKNSDKVLAKLPLQVINYNFNTLVHRYNQKNTDNIPQDLSQQLCALLISMSLSSVGADIMGYAENNGGTSQNLVEVLNANSNDLRQHSFNFYLQELYRRYKSFKCDGEKENSWHTINEWVGLMIARLETNQETNQNVQPAITKEAMTAIRTFLDI
ncbi:hypothetical protein F9222_25355 [Escherichia coli]|nr:hypothetical protein F9222_25355 [Escherichia coli]